jgi:hypothetical protein
MADQKFKSKVKLEGGVSLPAETASRAPVIDGSGNIVSSAVTATELGYVAGLTSSAQTQITAAQDDATQALTDAGTAQTTANDHIADAVDAHDASAISNIPAGNLAATEVQAALNELQSDIDTRALQSALQAHLDDAVDAHDASAISSVAAGNLAATDVQSALNELQSDIDSRALDSAVIKKDGSVAFTANQSMGGFKLTNLNSPTAAQDAASKSYVDAVATGLSPKASAKASTVSALPAVTAAGSGVGKTLTADANGALSLDGISVFVDIDNDGGSANPVDSIGTRASRVLIKDQVNAIDNGIYAVQDKGSAGTPFILVRSVDTDGTPASEVESVFIFVREGTVNADTGWTMITDAPIVDTSALDFVQFSAAGQVIGGNGINKTGNTLSVDHDGEGLTFSGVQLALELDGSTLSKSASGVKLSDTAVTPASYGSASESLSVTVDQQGRLTAAAAQSIAITASQVSDFDEAAQDAVGGMVASTDTITLTYTDGTPELKADVNTQLSITSDASGIKLVNDAASPGNSKYYGTDGAGAKGFHAFVTGSAGDIAETSFSAADSQAAPASITGLAFAAGTVRSFKVLLSVSIDATADLFEAFELVGVNKGGSFDMAVSSVGDDSSITLSITAAGQVQYTSGTAAGFVSNTIKFRAITTSL